MIDSTPPPCSPCPHCGYLAEGSASSLNFCPKCGQDLRADAAPSGPDPSTTAFLGQVIADRYRLTGLLGEGGMGAVFQAEHVRMGKALAVKLLRGSFARDHVAVERFKAEARIVSRLSHPHTIAVFDFGELQSREGFYLAMEYVRGKDLAAVLRELGTLPEARASRIAEQLLGSLAEAHDAGIVHRDVKPANVMLMDSDGGDYVKVLDFGIAKLRDPTGGSDTTEGVIIGTPNYLAPEQARGEDIDARADLYSVGAMLYELLCGHPPFVHKNPVAVMHAHLTQEPAPLRSAAGGVSAGLAAVVHRALMKDARRRYQTASEMRHALLAAQGRRERDLSVQLPSAADSQLASRADFEELERQKRRLRTLTLAPLLVIAGMALAAGLVWRWPEIHGWVRQRFPAAAGLVPEALRPAGQFDGREHEPNDTPADANAVILPPGPDGRLAGGVALVRGAIGARRDAATGDVDVFRVEVPNLGRPLVLVADWRGSAAGEGIRGLEVVLTLNRDRSGEAERKTAPLLADSHGGGPGLPVRLASLVEPGAYFLSVRERHPEGSPPVERPGEVYELRLSLLDPVAGEELEPNDDPSCMEQARRRYPEWQALAERNPLSEGGRIEGETAADDPDTYAVAPRAPGEKPELVLLVPGPGLALTAQLWLPDAQDLAPIGDADRERFLEAGVGSAGEVLVLRLPEPPRAGAPALVRLRAARGQGRYEILALGKGAATGPPLVSRLDALARLGGGAQALAMAAAFARELPGAAARSEVLRAAGRVAEEIAERSAAGDLGQYQAAAQRLGFPVFEAREGKLRYGAAFESLADGSGRSTEEALHRAAFQVVPCSSEVVRSRAQAYLSRFASSARAPAVRLQLARALEEEYWGLNTRAALKKALDQYQLLARGKGPAAAVARERVRDLSRGATRPAVSRMACE